MKSNIENTFIKLLSVCCNLLNTSFAFQVPQSAMIMFIIAPRSFPSPDAAVVAAADKIETVLVHGQAGDAVQVSHHTVHQLARVVIIEPDVPVLVSGDGEGKGGM